MDPIVDSINNWVHKTAKEAVPGRRLVEIFPWMIHIPTVLAPWKKWALGQEVIDDQMFRKYLDEMPKNQEVSLI